MLIDIRSTLGYAELLEMLADFFEAFGSAGYAALERIRAKIPAGIPVVADAKRGDIGTTAARQAVALFDALGVDAVTVNPYLGSEAVTPLIERLDPKTEVIHVSAFRPGCRSTGATQFPVNGNKIDQ